MPTVDHSYSVIEIITTDVFDDWLAGLKDIEARARIRVRIRRMSLGNSGDVKALGDGIREMRFSFGPGYRVYFTQRGVQLVLLLAGGDKSGQSRDIERARQIAAQWKDQP